MATKIHVRFDFRTCECSEDNIKLCGDFCAEISHHRVLQCFFGEPSAL